MRIVIAGSGSAVGKTTISTGIMGALSEEYRVQPFKVGPDYIDPTYHTLATGVNSRNLDSFFMNNAQIREAYINGLKSCKSQLGIIEGVRGLYEGIGPIGDVGSTASIAKALNAPVILILNTRSLVKSAAAIVLGFKNLDPKINIKGVILNQVKNRNHYLKTKQAVETLAKTDVIGGLPRDESMKVEDRHLGLVPAVERANIIKSINKWSEMINDYLDLDAIISIMKDSEALPEGREAIWKVDNHKHVKIGVAMDEVFSFYYQDNFDAMKENHAVLIPFSPLHDEEIPDVDGLYIGGGYPEIFAKKLEANHNMRDSVLKFHLEGNPIYAECGGLMYLSKSINNYDMCNVFNYPAVMTKKPQALSYTISKAVNDNIMVNEGDIFKGHEFHYSKVNLNGVQRFAFQMLRGKGIQHSMDGLMDKNTVASYVHTHVAAYPPLASNFTSNIAEI